MSLPLKRTDLTGSLADPVNPPLVNHPDPHSPAGVLRPALGGVPAPAEQQPQGFDECAKCGVEACRAGGLRRCPYCGQQFCDDCADRAVSPPQRQGECNCRHQPVDGSLSCAQQMMR